MLSNLKGISLSYKHTPVNIRELFSLNEDGCKSLLIKIRQELDINEAIVISTCNRTEIFYYSDICFDQKLIALLNNQSNGSFLEMLSYFEIFNTQETALQHIFRVSVGLESQVLGDLQISNQIKNAYQWTVDVNMAGPFLHRLMHTIFFTNKKIVQETSFRDGAASVSYATAELVDDLLNFNKEAKILVIGLGEIGTDTAKNLISMGYKNLFVSNRTSLKSLEFIKNCDLDDDKFVDFEQFITKIKNANVVISAVECKEPIITKETLTSLNLLSHKFFIDLAMPRSIDNKVEEVPGMIVYNIDDISRKTQKALETRKKSVYRVEEIIAESILDFGEWNKELQVSPILNKLKQALEQIRHDEVIRFGKQLNEESIKIIDEISKSMMQKIIKLPAMQLKAACKRGEADVLIDVLNDLFNLESIQEIKNSH